MSRQRIPYIPGWAPLELAEAELFPGLDPRQLTAEQRQQALTRAKALVAERLGVILDP